MSFTFYLIVYEIMFPIGIFAITYSSSIILLVPLYTGYISHFLMPQMNPNYYLLAYRNI